MVLIFIDFYFYVFNCRCLCGHGRVLPCFQVEDCIYNAAKKSHRSTLSQKPGRSLEHDDCITKAQHNTAFRDSGTSHSTLQGKQTHEQRITSFFKVLQVSVINDVHITWCSTQYQWSSDLHHRSLLKLSSLSSSTSPSTLQSSGFALFKWAVTIQPQHILCYSSTSPWPIWLVLNKFSLLAISFLSSYLYINEAIYALQEVRHASDIAHHVPYAKTYPLTARFVFFINHCQLPGPRL